MTRLHGQVAGGERLLLAPAGRPGRQVVDRDLDMVERDCENVHAKKVARLVDHRNRKPTLCTQVVEVPPRIVEPDQRKRLIGFTYFVEGQKSSIP